jgi:hypothetical protein
MTTEEITVERIARALMSLIACVLSELHPPPSSEWGLLIMLS